MKNFLLLHEDQAQSTVQSLGALTQIMTASKAHQTRDMAYFRHVINSLLAHDQIVILYNARKEAVAYYCWAFLAPDVEKRVISTGQWNLHISEWNEGTSLWLVDLAAPFGHINMVVRNMKQRFITQPRIRYGRIQATRYVVREIQK
ncbi:toxin-activating lysine-acyltransferase [Massilia aerilata]|uniref:RTX toxin-activating lysine-acyltransferase n=1 Tax=Massilia aerilata TaxID=453817 RepID=A0ABW0S499_9BURK